MRQNPKSDWHIEDMKSVARAKGIEWRQPGTSHVTFRRIDGGKLTVPARKPIKSVYVRMFVEFMEGA
jgi:predicted RNA binding protein YcfA (HicA-like mRNA interferase family)